GSVSSDQSGEEQGQQDLQAPAMTDPYLQPWRFPVDFHVDEDPCSFAWRMARSGSMTSKQFLHLYLKGSPDLGLNSVVVAHAPLMRLAVIAGIPQEELSANTFVPA